MKNMLIKFILNSYLVLVISWALPTFAQTPYPLQRALSVTINSSINPSTLSYIKSALDEARLKGMQLLIIRMNTPGGLVQTTKSILTTMGESTIPVVVWVAPEGASATSAGAIISSGAHFLFMSPGTNIGAATPIELTGDMAKDLRKKAVNDLVALVKGLSHERGRNEELFSEMISKASSFSANEAKEKGLINGLATSYPELWEQMKEKSFTLKGASYKIQISGNVEVVDFPMTTGESLIDILAHPSLAYILFLLGAALIYFELQTPGGFIAGTIGVGLLILSGIGFDVLPLNFGALALIVLSFIFFILEAFITSYGLLTIGGLISLTLGSLFLFHGDAGTVNLGLHVIVSSVFGVAAFTGLVAFYLIRGKKVQRNFFTLDGASGSVVTVNHSGDYQINVKGEIWHAVSTNDLNIGDEVVVIKKLPQKLTLEIRAKK